MVGTKVSHRHGHVVHNAVGKAESVHKEVSPVLRLAEDIGNTVGIDRFAVVVGVVVFVTVRVGCRHHRKHHKGVSLSLGFLQVVAAVVPTALQGSRLRGKARNIHAALYKGTTAILGMASRVEPGFRLTRTVDSVKLDGGVANHGVDAVADDKGGRIFLANLNAEPFVLGQRQSSQVANANKARRASGGGLVAFLVCGSSIGSSSDFPAGFGIKSAILQGSIFGNRRAIQVHHRESLATSSRRNVVELLLGILGQVARLVHADTANAEVAGIQERLVQGVGNKAIGDKILGLGANRGDRIAFCLIGDELAEALYGSAVVDRCSVPRQGPHGANQIIGSRLFLFHSHDESRQGTSQKR